MTKDEKIRYLEDLSEMVAELAEAIENDDESSYTICAYRMDVEPLLRILDGDI